MYIHYIHYIIYTISHVRHKISLKLYDQFHYLLYTHPLSIPYPHYHPHYHQRPMGAAHSLPCKLSHLAHLYHYRVHCTSKKFKSITYLHGTCMYICIVLEQLTVFSVHLTLYSVHLSLYSVHSILSINHLQCIVSTCHYIVYTCDYIVSTCHYIVYTCQYIVSTCHYIVSTCHYIVYGVCTTTCHIYLLIPSQHAMLFDGRFIVNMY